VHIDKLTFSLPKFKKILSLVSILTCHIRKVVHLYWMHGYSDPVSKSPSKAWL
jgi:hypothetical protein